MHRVVRTLVRRAQRRVQIDTVLCDREFDSNAVYQLLSNLGVNYLVSKRFYADDVELIGLNENPSSELLTRSRLEKIYRYIVYQAGAT